MTHRWFVLFLAAGACSSVPPPVSEQGFAGVQVGVTTRAELDRRFGVPTWVEFVDWDRERLTWHHPQPSTRHEFAPLEYRGRNVLEAVYEFQDGVVVQKSWAQLVRRDDGVFEAVAKKVQP